MNLDVGSRPLARPFACLLAPLTQLLIPHCSIRSRIPLCSFVPSFACSPTQSRAREKVDDKMLRYHAVLNHSGLFLCVRCVLACASVCVYFLRARRDLGENTSSTTRRPPAPQGEGDAYKQRGGKVSLVLLLY